MLVLSTSWKESASLPLVGHPPSSGVTTKIPYGWMIYYINQPYTPSFPIGLVKIEFNIKTDFIFWSVETGLGRCTLVVAVISVDTYPFLAFSYLTCHLEETRIGAFRLHSVSSDSKETKLGSYNCYCTIGVWIFQLP